MARITKKLKVVDDNAPSDKYPERGFSVDFRDDEGQEYFVEYPNYQSMKIEFKKGESYNLSFLAKEQKTIASSDKVYYKISHIKFADE